MIRHAGWDFIDDLRKRRITCGRNSIPSHVYHVLDAARRGRMGRAKGRCVCACTSVGPWIKQAAFVAREPNTQLLSAERARHREVGESVYPPKLPFFARGSLPLALIFALFLLLKASSANFLQRRKQTEDAFIIRFRLWFSPSVADR